MKKNNILLVYAFLTVASLLIAFPIFFAFLKATQSTEQIIAARLLPSSYFWQNLNTVWQRYRFADYMWNSFKMSIWIVIGKTTLSFFAAFALVFLRFRGKKIIFSLILITLMMPTEMLIIGLFDVISLQPPQNWQAFLSWLVHPQHFFKPVPFGLGWSNTTAAIVVPFLASATAVFFFRQHFLNVPPSLVDAALIDGASPFHFIWHVLLPLSKNTIGALVVVQFVFAWNQYLWPRVILRSEELQVTQIALKNMMATSARVDWGSLMAGTLLSLIPPLLILIIFQKQLMHGIAFSEDK